MEIQELTLRSRALDAQRAFYSQTLGLPLSEADEARFSVRVGATRLRFVHEADFGGFYHFAFTVPENQIQEARAWLQARVPLLRDAQGEQVFFSKEFNTHNVYFDDADGNIVELIARHDLPNASVQAFGPASLLQVSEIGLVAPSVSRRVRDLREQHGLGVYKAQSDTFTAVGTATGMFITVPLGRGWFPVGRPAPCAPFELTALTPRGLLRYEHACREQGGAA